ncbi:MAG: protein phosphatase 1 regulatory subunit 42 [Raineya sp.]|nr:protein phosphatase 1 regulatory subunit 42 [Raineya sp.]
MNEKINKFSVDNPYHFLFQTIQTNQNNTQKDYYFVQKQKDNSLEFFKFQELNVEGIEDFRGNIQYQEQLLKETHPIRFVNTDELCIEFKETINYHPSVDIEKEDIYPGYLQGIGFVRLENYAQKISLEEVIQAKDENNQYITKAELWEVITDKVKELPEQFVTEFNQIDEIKVQNADKALDYFAYLEKHVNTNINNIILTRVKQKFEDIDFKNALKNEFNELIDLSKEFVKKLNSPAWKNDSAETFIKAYHNLSYELRQFQISNNHSSSNFEKFFSKLERIGLLEKIESIEICFEKRMEGNFRDNLEKYESKLSKLTQICLYGNTDIPIIRTDIPRLKGVESLIIAHSHQDLKTLDLHEFPQLKSLALNEVSPELKLTNTQNSKIQELYWVESSLRKVPEEIFDFKDLSVLSLRENNIIFIPPQMKELPLHFLNLTDNKIEVAENIPTHTLDKLYLNKNSIENLSKGMIEFIALNKSATIDLSNNNTERLQQNISIGDWIKMHVAQLGKIFGFSDGQIFQLFEKKGQENSLKI